jgi:hypothetical protein
MPWRSRCRRDRPRRLQALKDNPELLVIRPSPPSAGLNDLQPFNLSTVLMAVHKHCYTSLKLTNKAAPPEGDNPPPHKIFNLFNSRSFLLDLFLKD